MVMAATKEKKIISTTNLGAAVYSTPVIANGVIYVGSQTHLYAFADPSKGNLHNDEMPKLELEPKK